MVNDGKADSESDCVTITIPDFDVISGGWGHSLALKRDGTVWAWGYNSSGQLGDGTSGDGTDRTTPVQVKGKDGAGFLTNIVSISAGRNHSLGLKRDASIGTPYLFLLLYPITSNLPCINVGARPMCLPLRKE